MKLLVLAIGQGQPAWAEAAWDDVAKRFPPEMRLEVKARKAEPRGQRSEKSICRGRLCFCVERGPGFPQFPKRPSVTAVR